jgi:predicted DNA-binding transcriptional regulator AlpA
MRRRLRAPEAAALLGLSTSTLAKLRLKGTGPEFEKCGPRIVVYDEDALEIWLRSRRKRSTSELMSNSP